MIVDTARTRHTKLGSLPWDAVRWTGGFWKDVTDTTDKATVPQLRRMFDSASISHIVENFRICAGDAEGAFDGTVFGDGDFYKWMESAVYAAKRQGDEELLSALESYIALIGRAQRDDGYISTKQIINGSGPLSDVNDFEIYNMGHMFTSACLYKRLTGSGSFLAIAEKAAASLEGIYHSAMEKGEVKTAVCPSHYMGLIELYRTTGNKRWLDLARLAIELRDSVKDGTDDNQDREKLLEQRKIKGHAVRANYLYAGVADLYLEEGGEGYLEVLRSVWDDLVSCKLYITGGCGALYNGASPYGNFFSHQLVHQAYGYPYQLPNITAYNETCADIGLVLWAYRMFLIDQKAEYFDVLERTLLNTVLSGVSIDGKRFFYENMLRRDERVKLDLVWPLTRTEYITSYCCPPNLARVLSESSEYAALVSDGELYLGIYGNAAITLDGIKLEERTEYPFDGRIVLEAAGAEEGKSLSVYVRIPDWCSSGRLTTPDGKERKLTAADSSSYIKVDWKEIRAGDAITLQLDMPAIFVAADSRVEEALNQAAVTRGPLVYCLEAAGSPVPIDSLVFDPETEWTPVRKSIAGREISALRGKAWSVRRAESGKLYSPVRAEGAERVEVELVPYAFWDNREYGDMRVFLPLSYQFG